MKWLAFKLILLSGWTPAPMEMLSYRIDWLNTGSTVWVSIYELSEPEKLLLRQVISE